MLRDLRLRPTGAALFVGPAEGMHRAAASLRYLARAPREQHKLRFFLPHDGLMTKLSCNALRLGATSESLCLPRVTKPRERVNREVEIPYDRHWADSVKGAVIDDFLRYINPFLR